MGVANSEKSSLFTGEGFYPGNIELMSSGKAPRIWNAQLNKYERFELHHSCPQWLCGPSTKGIVPMTHSEHTVFHSRGQIYS